MGGHCSKNYNILTCPDHGTSAKKIWPIREATDTTVEWAELPKPSGVKMNLQEYETRHRTARFEVSSPGVGVIIPCDAPILSFGLEIFTLC